MWSPRSVGSGMPYEQPAPVEYRTAVVVDGVGRVSVDASMLRGIADIAVGSPELAHVVVVGDRVVVDGVRPAIASNVLAVAAGKADCPGRLKSVFASAVSGLELAADKAQVETGLAKLFGGR